MSLSPRRKQGTPFSLLVCLLVAGVLSTPPTVAQSPEPQFSCYSDEQTPGKAIFLSASGSNSHLTDVEISYTVPLQPADPHLFGKVIPYGTVWLDSSGLAPTFKSKDDLHIETLLVPAGTYSLYFLPLQTGWKLIVNKQTGQRGDVYDESQDLGRVKMTHYPSANCEALRLDFERIPGQNCNGRCDPRNGPFVPNDIYGKLTIHFAWANANEYVILQREEKSNRAASGEQLQSRLLSGTILPSMRAAF
jgi:hypothetical protein